MNGASIVSFCFLFFFREAVCLLLSVQCVAYH